MNFIRHLSDVSKISNQAVGQKVKKKVIEFTTIPSIIPVTAKFIDKSDFSNYSSNIPDHSVKQSISSYSDSRRLPQVPTDIKGVDPEAYFGLTFFKGMNQIPLLIDNDFFNLKFIPKQHFIAQYRKSNIAYTFQNHGGYKLNDPELEKSVNSYKGRYKANTFFMEKLTPFSTAFGRIRYRKLLKRLLFNAVKEVEDKNDPKALDLAGIYKFSFKRVPNTSEEIDRCQGDLLSSVDKILHHKQLQTKLIESYRDAKFKNGDLNNLRSKATLYNTVRPQRVPGFLPKYPFLNPKPVRRR
ncbi:hypothetical protein DFJ63DRAFT_335669 [Scheffersomyces coipomensis]|uniref:uncharacterized protein n=1 Tax=Scheffersomyces coipomensis TaxID=1788519 RepID=UPI00315D29A3